MWFVMSPIRFLNLYDTVTSPQPLGLNPLEKVHLHAVYCLVSKLYSCASCNRHCKWADPARCSAYRLHTSNSYQHGCQHSSTSILPAPYGGLWRAGLSFEEQLRFRHSVVVVHEEQVLRLQRLLSQTRNHHASPVKHLSPSHW